MGKRRWDSLKEKRREAPAKGLCSQCAARVPKPGNKQCDVCISKRVEKRKRRKIEIETSGNGWCNACQAYGFHREHITGSGKADCPRLMLNREAELMGLKLII